MAFTHGNDLSFCRQLLVKIVVWNIHEGSYVNVIVLSGHVHCCVQWRCLLVQLR